MSNVLKKCLCKDLGESDYEQYVDICRETFVKSPAKAEVIKEHEVFLDIQGLLSKESDEELKARSENMEKATNRSITIAKSFVFIVVYYVLANIVLIGMGLDYYVTCVSLALIGICFLYKLIEFLSNKYCFIDAYLMMIYKAALDEVYHS